MFLAVLSDLKSDKIVNNIIVLGFIGIFLNLMYECSLQVFISAMAGILFPTICLFPLFYFHMFGAGDIKLLAVAGGLLGLKGVLFCIVVSIFTGALFSVFKLCKYQLFRERFAYFSHYIKMYLQIRKRIPYYDDSLSKKARVHFSVPIAISVAGYYFVVWGGMFI